VSSITRQIWREPCGSVYNLRSFRIAGRFWRTESRISAMRANRCSRDMFVIRATKSSFASSAALGRPKARSRIALQATEATRSSSLSISSISRRMALGAARRASLIATPYSPECPDGFPDWPGCQRLAASAGDNALFGADIADPTQILLASFYIHRDEVGQAVEGRAGGVGVRGLGQMTRQATT